MIQHKEAFLLFTKSVFCEFYKKRSAILKMQKLIKLFESNKLPPNNKDIAEAGIEGGQFYIDNDFPAYEKKIYEYAINKNYRGISFIYKLVDKFIPISLSTTINPLFNNHVPILGVEQPFFSFTILPYKQYGLVVISWFVEYDEHMLWVKERFDSDFSKLINYLCFIESEDYFLSPTFYEKKIKVDKDFFQKAFFNRISFPDFGFNDTKIFFNFL